MIQMSFTAEAWNLISGLCAQWFIAEEGPGGESGKDRNLQVLYVFLLNVESKIYNKGPYNKAEDDSWIQRAN